MAENLNAGIPQYEIAETTAPNAIMAPQIPEAEIDPGIEISQDIQKRYDTSQPDISQPFYKPAVQNLFQPSEVKPSLEGWNTNVDEAYTQLNNGTYIARFENYMSGVDNENRLALQQGTGEKWLNGISKFGAKTAINVLDGTVGTVNGALQGISNGSLDAVYNNDFSKFIDDLNTKLDNKLPNYYSQQEKNASLGSNIFTANFLADKVLRGMSFVTGTIISEALWATATGGASLAVSLPRRLAAEAGEQAIRGNRVMHSITSIMDAYQRTVPISKAMKAFNNARFLYTSAGYESGVEARYFLKEAEANYIQSYQNANGRRPSGEELGEFRNSAVDGGNAVFAANLALVGGSNIAQFGDIFGVASFLSTKGLQRGLNRSIGIGIERTVEAGVDAYRAINPTRAQRILGTAFNVLKSPFREGVIEEGGQSVFGNFGQRWLESKYDPNALQENFSAIDAMGKSLYETYGTKAGQEEILIGALIGGLASARTGFGLKDYNSEVEAQKGFAELRTANSDYNLIQKFSNAAAQKSARDKVAQNLSKEEAVLANQELNMALFSKFDVDSKMGLLDNSDANFRASLEELNPQELAQQLGVGIEQAETAKAEAIEAHSLAIESYKEARDIAESVIPQDAVYGKVPASEVQSMLALNIYMGKSSDRLSRAYATSIGEIMGDKGTAPALALENLLQDSKVNKSREVKNLAKELRRLDVALNTRNQELLKIASRPRTEVGDSRLVEFENRRQELLAQEQRDQERRDTINSELAGIASDINKVQKARNIANQDFSEVLREGTYTAEELLEASQTLESLSDTLSVWNQNGQEKAAQDVIYMLDQYDKAQKSFTYANDAYNRLSDPVMREQEVKTIFTSIFSKFKKKNIEPTEYHKASQELYASLARQYQEFKSLTPVEQEQAITIETQEGDMLPELIQADPALEQEIREKYEQLRTSSERKTLSLSEISIGQGVETLNGRGTVTAIEGDMVTIEMERGTLNANPKVVEIFAEQTDRDKADGIRETLENLASGIEGSGARMIAEYVQRIRNGESKESITQGLPQSFIDAIDSQLAIENTAQTEQFDELESQEAEELRLLREQIPAQGTLQSRLRSIVDQILKGRRDIEGLSSPMRPPTQAEMDEYKALYERNRKSTNGLKAKDKERFEELKDMFNNYGRAVGTYQGGIRLSDILSQLAFLESSLPETATTQTVSNTNTEEIQARLTASSQGKDNFDKTQYWEKSEFRIMENGDFSITGINLQGLLDIINTTNNATVLNNKQKGQKNNRKKATALQGQDYEPGDRFIIRLEAGIEIGVTIGRTKGLEISPEGAKLLNEKTRLKLFPSTFLSTNYQPLLIEENADAEITPMSIQNTNFELEPGLSFTDLTSSSDNIELSLFVSTRNEYNKDLILKYNTNQISLKELQNSLAIYVMNSEGEVGGLLKAVPRQVFSEDANYQKMVEIRAVATKRALESNLENELVDVQISVPIDRNGSYFGKPNFNLELDKASGTLATKMIPISDKAVQKVTDVGYIENGKLNLKGNEKTSDKIDTSFVKALSQGRKIPVIIFNYNGSRIAYPVSMRESQRNIPQEFEELLSTSLPVSEKANALNQFLSDNGIDPNTSELGFYYVAGESNLQDPQTLESIRAILQQQTPYENFEEWQNADTVQQAKILMQSQAEINIDITDKPFHSPKLGIKLKEAVIIGNTAMPSVETVETASETIAQEINEEKSENTCG